jgi:hypothetical protein
MKGFIWNSDGFGDPAKHLAIKEAVREFNMDFVVISETGRGSFLVPFLANLVAGMDYSWYCLPPRGHFGGILSGINNASLVVTRVITVTFVSSSTLKRKETILNGP